MSRVSDMRMNVGVCVYVYATLYARLFWTPDGTNCTCSCTSLSLPFTRTCVITRTLCTIYSLFTLLGIVSSYNPFLLVPPSPLFPISPPPPHFLLSPCPSHLTPFPFVPLVPSFLCDVYLLVRMCILSLSQKSPLPLLPPPSLECVYPSFSHTNFFLTHSWQISQPLLHMLIRLSSDEAKFNLITSTTFTWSSLSCLQLPILLCPCYSTLLLNYLPSDTLYCNSIVPTHLPSHPRLPLEFISSCLAIVPYLPPPSLPPCLPTDPDFYHPSLQLLVVHFCK